jgi:hypothetical protein
MECEFVYEDLEGFFSLEYMDAESVRINKFSRIVSKDRLRNLHENKKWTIHRSILVIRQEYNEMIASHRHEWSKTYLSTLFPYMRSVHFKHIQEENNIVAGCAPAAATVQVLGVNLLLTPTCHESWCP